MTKSAPDAPEHDAVLELAMNSVTAHALYVVVHLGVPDLLVDAPLTATQISDRTGLQPDPVHRILRTLAGAGYFTESQDRFGLSDAGRTLVSGHPTAARDLVLTLVGPLFTGALTHLDATLRTGRSGTEEAFGQPIFEYLAQRPAAGDSFDRMMLGFHGTEPAAVVAAYDFSGAQQIVDVGGGVGTLLCTILAANPEPKGVLFEQPTVIANAQFGDLAGRVDLVEGDFFASVPAGGDFYVLSHILHDWPDEECLRILARCRDALAVGGRILIVEMVLPGDDAPHPSKFLDLIMLALAGGRERTSGDYRSLLSRAGLDLTRIVPTASAVSVIEARVAQG